MFLLCVVEKSISWPVGFDWSLIKTYSMLTFSKVKNRQKGNNVIHSSSYKGAYADEKSFIGCGKGNIISRVVIQ